MCLHSECPPDRGVETVTCKIELGRGGGGDKDSPSQLDLSFNKVSTDLGFGKLSSDLSFSRYVFITYAISS
jgi:hypothetical protein